MILWIFLALLTAAVVLALARPLTRAADAPDSLADADAAVYRDQLAEIDNDRERGLIAGVEADAARAEVARRLLKVTKIPAHAAKGGAGARTAPSATGLVKAALAAVPVAGMALYVMLGSPDLPGVPLADRQAAPTAETPVDQLIAQVEAELKKNPGDERGWRVIAPVYMRLKRYDDAAYAFSQIMRLKGEAIEPLLGFAEAALLANKGIVNDGIKRAAERVLALDASRVEPRVWLALGQQQDGDIAGAIKSYKALIASAPPGAPWLQPVEQQLQRLEGGKGDAALPDAGVQPPASSAAGAIAAMTPEEQQIKIASMVDGLAARLKQNANDLPGWLRLVRAYQVLGRKDDAVAALATARAQFASQPQALADLSELAKSLGL